MTQLLPRPTAVADTVKTAGCHCYPAFMSELIVALAVSVTDTYKDKKYALPVINMKQKPRLNMIEGADVCEIGPRKALTPNAVVWQIHSKAR